MSQTTSNTTSEQEPGGKGKSLGRSSVTYPYYDLDLSIEVAKSMHDKGGGTCSPDQLAAFLGYKTTKSGTYQTRTSAARQFGLIRSEGGVITVTDRAHQILSPVMPDDSVNAKAEAFLSVELFKKVFDKFKGMAIPPEIGLKNLLLQNYGFKQDRLVPAIRVLMDSAEQAGFFIISGDRTRLIRPATKSSGTVNTGKAAKVPEKQHAESPTDKPRFAGGGGGDGPAGVHSAIIGLLRELPSPGSDWPVKQKTRFVKAFQATLDFIYPSDDDDGEEL